MGDIMNHSLKLISSIMAGVLFLFGCQEDVPPKEIVRPVKAMKVADQATFTDARFPGITEATRQVDLSFRVGGPMISRPVNVGDEVKTGLLVARIDPRDYQVRLRTAQGQLANAIAVRKRAQADLDRLLRIQKQDAGAVTGGGLTIIANAPNPAAVSLLKKYFTNGIGAGGILRSALAPTVIMLLIHLFTR